MAWGTIFKGEMNRANSSPMFLLESVQLHDEPPGGVVKLSSFVVGPEYQPIIAKEGVTVAGQRLRPVTWDTSLGSTKIPIVRGVINPRTLRRGATLQLRVGYPGMALSEFEVVTFGQLWSATVRGGLLELTIRDPSAFGSRLTSTNAQTQLFYGLTLKPTVETDVFTKNSSTTLTVDFTSGVDKALSGSDDGVIYVTDPGNPDDPFYLRYTGTTATSFTGIDPADTFGTTQKTIAAGELPATQAVEEVAFYEGHPARIAQEVLTSDGTAINGALPEGWGLGMPRWFLDFTDIQRTIDHNQPASGSALWVLLERGGVDDPGGWLRSFLAPGGYFLTTREGRLTVRAMPSLINPTIILDEDHIVDIVSHEWWDPDYSVEYIRYSVTDAEGNNASTTTEAANSWPLRSLYEVAIPVWENQAAQTAEVDDRLAQYIVRVPELMTVQLAGVHGSLSIGDEVKLSTTRSVDRQGRAFENRACVIVGVEPNWWAGTNQVTLLIPMDTATEV